MNRRIFIVLLVLLLIGIGFLRLRRHRLVKHTFVLMDTYVDFVVDNEHSSIVGLLAKRGRDLEKKLSFFSPNSCVSKLNERKNISAEDECFPILADLINISQKVWKETDGAFDPGFRGDVPISNVQVDGKGIVVPSGGRFDFSGIAKGYIVDELIRLARERGVDFIMVNAGGDVGVWDKKGVGVWVEVKDPQAGSLDRVRIVRGAVATSGNYYRGGHIIDPRTKRVVSGLISASAQDGSCAVSDAWATALFVLGRKGLSLAENSGVGAIVGLIGESGKIVAMKNNRWQKFLDKK